jgi:hypothetical protein
MLGEELPPLRLLLQDSHGNAVPADAAAWAERQVQLQVLQGSVAGGGAVLQELNVVADTVGDIRLYNCLRRLSFGSLPSIVTLRANSVCAGCGLSSQMFRYLQLPAAAITHQTMQRLDQCHFGMQWLNSYLFCFVLYRRCSRTSCA